MIQIQNKTTVIHALQLNLKILIYSVSSLLRTSVIII